MTTHVVLRDFEEGRPLKAGERVDALSWANLPMLEDQGYLRRLSPAERVEGEPRAIKAKRPAQHRARSRRRARGKR